MNDILPPYDRTELNLALTTLVGQKLKECRLYGAVTLSFEHPVDQALVLVTPFTVGPPGLEEIVFPGRYGPSIVRAAELLWQTVTSATTDPSEYDLRVGFSNGSRLVVLRHPFEARPDALAEWRFWAGPGLDPNHVWFID